MDQRKVTDLLKKSLKFRALFVSIVIHVVVLSCFAVVTFSGRENESEPKKQVSAEIRNLNKFVSRERIVKKPKFKDIAESDSRGYELRETGERIISRNNSSEKTPGDSEPRYVTSPAEKVAGEYTESSVTFFDNRAYARKVCYLVDCSGSMKGIFTGVQKRLKQSINQLRQDQYFEILFFNENVTGFSDKTLVRASENNRQKAINFIDITKPSGTTKALEALEAALKVEDAAGESAKLVYFLTDGFELSGREAEEFSRSAKELLRSAGGNIQVNVIAFWPQPSDEKVLSDIADSAGGEIVVIDR